jgi:hypothetical protein
MRLSMRECRPNAHSLTLLLDNLVIIVNNINNLSSHLISMALN